MKKSLSLIIVLIITMFIANPSVEAISVKESEILYNSYVIGTYLYTADENDIYDTTNEETIYDEDLGLFTKEIMLGATSISGNKYEDMIVYYKDFWDVWGDGLSGEDITVGDTFEITHVNGVCIDPSCSGNSISVKFKFNDNVTQEKNVSLNYGEVVSNDLIPATSVRTGYEFACWTLEGEEECFDFSTKLIEDTVLEAKWNLFTYTITFKDDIHNLTETAEACSFAAGNECEFLDYKDVFSAVPEGYTFVGWSLAPSGEKVYSKANYKELFSNNETITLYAIFNSGTYTVAYNLNGGTFGVAVSPVTEYDPANLTYALYEPSRIGYTFNGWSLDSSSSATAIINNQSKEFTITKLGDVVLKANWVPITYTLVYNDITLASCTYDVVCDINLSLIEVDAGKELTKLEVVINGTNYEIGNKVKNLVIKSGNYDIIPTIDEIHYNVSYNLNGGKLTTENESSLVVGDEITLNVPARDGYTFKGWLVVSGNASINGNKLTLNGATDVKVSAKWEANTYKLAYSGVDYATCTYDQECELRRMASNPVGHTFLGWTLKKTSEVLGDNVYNLTTKNETLEIEPILSANTYNITYDLVGGSITAINPSKYVYGDKTLNVAEPSKPGYVFGGWISDNDSIVSTSGSLSVDNATGDVKLTANWIAKTYSLKFSGTGVSTSSQDCTYDQECKIKDYTPTNGNLVFDGWAYKGYVYQSGQVINLDEDGDVTLVARWINDDKYEITYNLNRGHFEAEPVRMYIIGDVIQLPTPNRDGYVFDGWYTDNQFNNKINDSVLTTDKKDIKLYAKWNPITYRLMYNDVVLNTCTYAVDCTIDTAKFNVEDGYEITKIYATIDDKAYEIGTKVKNLAIKNSDVKVTIEVEELGFDIDYDLDGGKVSQDNPTKISYMEDKVLVEPTKTGYTFKGWEVIVGNADVTNTSVKLTNVENIKLKALWNVNTYTLEYDGIVYASCTYDQECSLEDLEEDKWPTGKIFANWTYGNNIGLGDKVINLSIVDKAKIEITPKFDDYNILITYDYKGGVVSEDNDGRVIFNDSIELNVPSKTGYTFKGWNVDKGQAQVVDNTLTVNGTSDVKVSAKWEANTYELVYENNVYATCTYDQKCTLTNYEDKIEEGKEFDYWSYENTKLDSSVINLTTNNAVKLDIVPNFKDIEYKISYNLNGGIVQNTNPDRISIANEGLVLVEPTRVGYTFDSWEVVFGDASVTNTTIKLNAIGDVSLKAKWIANTYTLEYKDNVYATCTYDTECTLNELEDSLWEDGKKFINWVYMDKDLGDVIYNLTSEKNEKIKISPKYEKYTYYILYDYDNGVVSSVNPMTYNVEDTTIELNVPSKSGYTFKGWNITNDDSKATLNGNVLNINGNVGDINISALYDVNTYNVTYDLDGGSATIDNHTCTVDSCTLSDTVPVKDKYDFVGWIDSNTGYIYGSGCSIAITSDVSLKAKWTNKNSYKINYRLNGGKFVDHEGNEIAPNISYYAGEAPVLTSPIKTGYTFNGWLVDGSDVPTTTLEAGLDKDLDLVAKYTANTYNVTYAVGSFLDDDVTVSYTYDGEYTLNDYVSEFEALGYKLLGWELSVDAGLYFGNGLSFKNLQGGLSNITLYPVVEKIEDDYKISYYLDGGSFVNPNEVIYSYNEGEAITLPDVVKPGYELAAWKMSDENIIDGTETNINKDVVLIPLWNKINNYTITMVHEFDETLEPSVVSCSLDETCTIPSNEVIREGYTFTGWLLELTGEGGNALFADGDNFDMSWDVIVDQGTNDFILKSQWSIVGNNISYNVDGDSSMLPSTYLPTDQYIRIPMNIDSNSNGASLVAWTLEDGTILDLCQDDSNYSCIEVTEDLSDITLTAHYNDEVYQVSWSYEYEEEGTLYTDNGTSDVVFGNTITGLLEEIPVDGFNTVKISSWSLEDDTIIDLSLYRVTSNVSIKAVF